MPNNFVNIHYDNDAAINQGTYILIIVAILRKSSKLKAHNRDNGILSSDDYTNYIYHMYINLYMYIQKSQILRGTRFSLYH